MRRFVPRALFTSAVAVLVTAACAGPYEPPAGISPDGETPGGRFRVLIPNFDTAEGVASRAGQQAAEEMRTHVAEMDRHTSVPASELRHAMRHFGVSDLDAITVVQLADRMNAQLATWGTVDEAPDGSLVAEIEVVNVQSGERLDLGRFTAGDPETLGRELHAGFDRTVQGIERAAWCLDYLGSDQFERALENCEQALEIVPESEPALYGKATALLNLDRHDEALAVYEELLEVNPEHEDGLLGAGFASSQLGETTQATAFYQRYLELRPEDVQVRLSISGDIAQTGDFVSAFRVLEPVIADHQDDVEFLEYLGRVATAAGQRARETGDAAEARRYFEVAVDAYERVYEEMGDELDPATIRQMAAALREMDRQDEAVSLLERATRTHGDDARIWQVYGQELARVERHRDAIQAYSRAIDLDPDLEQIHLRRAISRMEIGERQSARADFDEAARRGDPAQVTRFILARGGEAVNRGDHTDAAQLFEMAAQYAPSDMRSEVNFYWGHALFQQGHAIAQANTQGQAQPAQRALNIFRQALSRFEASTRSGVAEMRQATQDYIANQEAIIRAAQRR